jgi:hypothetical protein
LFGELGLLLLVIIALKPNIGALMNLEPSFLLWEFHPYLCLLLTGIIADKWINAEKLYGILHILGGLMLCCIPFVTTPTSFFG